MAVTITRTAWIDDDGTGTSGTVINNAEKTTLYNQIDAALAQVLPLAGGTLSGNLSINGLLAVNVSGTHSFNVNSAGLNAIQVSNFGNTPTSAAGVQLGNNVTGAHTILQSFAAGFAASGLSIADSSLVAGNGAGGLSLATGGNAPIRLCTNGANERIKIDGGGFVSIGGAGNYLNVKMGIAASVSHGMSVQNLGIWNGINLVMFINQANAACGLIAQTSETSVAYNTTSDARLKIDRGRVVDLSALRGVVVHDFTWTADGVRDRGVFAQEAIDVFPRAIAKGTDECTDDGHLKLPWMTDYSKFVPDLIAGFQQHDAELAALRAAFATLKG